MKKDISNDFRRLDHGASFDALSTMYPCSLKSVVGAQPAAFSNPTSTFYGFVSRGRYRIRYNDQIAADLVANAFFCCPGNCTLEPLEKDSASFVIERHGYRGLFQIGLVEENDGRLCYIDNASTTILVPPPRLGDPVLNYLVFPPNVVQTPHIHPTIRLGLVFGGNGECVLNNGQKVPLAPGTLFYLPERLIHSFNSLAEGLKIIAFHPDSDVGPTDSSHPMLSRTYKVETPPSSR